MGLLWDSCGIAVGTVVVLQDCCEIATRLLWDYYGIAVVLFGGEILLDRGLGLWPTLAGVLAPPTWKHFAAEAPKT